MIKIYKKLVDEYTIMGLSGLWNVASPDFLSISLVNNNFSIRINLGIYNPRIEGYYKYITILYVYIIWVERVK